jgi:hypothetical protein
MESDYSKWMKTHRLLLRLASAPPISAGTSGDEIIHRYLKDVARNAKRPSRSASRTVMMSAPDPYAANRVRNARPTGLENVFVRNDQPIPAVVCA